MKKAKLLWAILFLCISFKSYAEIVYVDPVRNAKLVNIETGIIIGFDKVLESPDLNSVINVRGELSGIHTGKTILTSDRKKIIFKPDVPFAFNEKVEVKVNSLKNIPGSGNRLTYTFHTQIRKAGTDLSSSILREIEKSANAGLKENSDSSTIPSLTVNISNNPSPGNLYLSNFPYLDIPYTPYLIKSNNAGNISFSRQMNYYALDFKKQPNGLLTYNINHKFYAMDLNYNIVDSFTCGNGYPTDEHELKIMNNGHAFLMSYDRQIMNMSQVVPGGNPNATVIGLIIQELDENKNVVFQWRSWDHFILTDAPHVDYTAAVVDYVHGNAIELDTDGNLMISTRHFSEITKISRTTGNIIWRLGGPRNQFTFVNDPAGFSYQHDIRRIANGNITLFDNGNYHSPPYSRAVEYKLDEVNKTATLIWQFRRTPDIFGFAMGNAQRLHNGNTLISWGATSPAITEVTPSGAIALEISLPQDEFTYRTYKDEGVLIFNAKIIMEGLYDTLINKLTMNDTVKAYVRSISAPFNIIDSASSNIDSVNFNGNFRFFNVPAGTYYICLRHRNSLETWSKTGGEVFAPGGVYSYDFTNSPSKAYGNNLVRKGLKYCIYSGDVDQSKNIDLTDIIQVFNNATDFVSGNAVTDVNGDKITDLSDEIIAYNNTAKFVSVKRP